MPRLHNNPVVRHANTAPACLLVHSLCMCTLVSPKRTKTKTNTLVREQITKPTSFNIQVGASQTFVGRKTTSTYTLSDRTETQLPRHNIAFERSARPCMKHTQKPVNERQKAGSTSPILIHERTRRDRRSLSQLGSRVRTAAMASICNTRVEATESSCHPRS